MDRTVPLTEKPALLRFRGILAFISLTYSAKITWSPRLLHEHNRQAVVIDTRRKCTMVVYMYHGIEHFLRSMLQLAPAATSMSRDFASPRNAVHILDLVKPTSYLTLQMSHQPSTEKPKQTSPLLQLDERRHPKRLIMGCIVPNLYASPLISVRPSSLSLAEVNIGVRRLRYAAFLRIAQCDVHAPSTVNNIISRVISQKSISMRYISSILINLATNASRWKMTLVPVLIRCS